MRKNLLVIAMFTANFYFGQIDSYGLKGGLNISSLATNLVNQSSQYSSITFDSNSKIGVYLGAYAEKKHTEKGSFVGEAILSFQGAKLTQKQSYSIPGYGSNSQSVVSNINITQLNIPVYYKYRTSEKFSIHGGGYLGLLLGSKIQSVAFNNNTIDLGLLAGASYVINDKITAEARYNLGLLKLDDFYNFQNRVLQLGISYKLK